MEIAVKFVDENSPKLEMIFLPMFVKYGKVKQERSVNMESEMFKLELD